MGFLLWCAGPFEALLGNAVYPDLEPSIRATVPKQELSGRCAHCCLADGFVFNYLVK